MNMEQQMGGGFEDRKVALGNQMQMQLAEIHGEQLGDFIVNHAQDFREVLNSNPNLLDEYAVKPDETLGKVEKILFH